MLFLSLSYLLILFPHLLIIEIDIALQVVVSILVGGLKSLFLFRVLFTVIVKLFEEGNYLTVESRDTLLMVFTLLFSDSLSLLAEILFGLAPLRVLLV